MDIWYKELPNRYERELAALRDANIMFTIDEEAKAVGFLRIHIYVTDKSKLQNIPSKFVPLKLIAVFPEKYPHFRVDVYAPEINLPRHQNFVGKNLCLLPRPTGYWLPETLLAEYLDEQLGKVLVEGEVVNPEILSGNPDEQAEPASEYFPCINSAPVLFDTTAYDSILNNPMSGIELIGTIKLGMALNCLPAPLVVTESLDKDRESLSSVPLTVKKLFPTELTGAIYKLPERPPHANAEEDLKWLIGALGNNGEKIYDRRQNKLMSGDTPLNIVGLTFPEEIKPGIYGWGWLFIVAFKQFQYINKNGRRIAQNNNRAYYAKVSRLDTKGHNVRSPKLKSLSDKKIVVIGLGSLGGPAAIEFARNGIGELSICDFDFVDAPTIIRWPLGITSTGFLKTHALEEFINTNYPFTKVRSFPFRIGGPNFDAVALPDKRFIYETTRIQELLDKSSLVFDAAAEVGLSHFLSLEAKKRNIPYVSISATPGVWGGTVLRIVPNRTNGCWMCMQYAQDDGSLPVPFSDPSGGVQAPGCGDISFIGTSFELQNIVQAGVRMAISTLASTSTDNQDLNSDVGILSLVDETGTPIFPKWSEHILEAHPKCPYCAT